MNHKSREIPLTNTTRLKRNDPSSLTKPRDVSIYMKFSIEVDKGGISLDNLENREIERETRNSSAQTNDFCWVIRGFELTGSCIPIHRDSYNGSKERELLDGMFPKILSSIRRITLSFEASSGIIECTEVLELQDDNPIPAVYSHFGLFLITPSGT